MKSLTWYRGSVLPYESLWSILLRATWLNDLRAGDLYRVANVNDPDALDMVARHGGDENIVRLIAKVLDEPLASFSDFCLIDKIPSWLFSAHASRRFRGCPECIRLGYHTWLMSINLVVECPIHNVPIREHCSQCGGEWKMSLRGLVVRNMGCHCGAKILPDPGSMRQPVLTSEAAQAWTEVAQWVQHAGNMCVNEMPPMLPESNIQLALTERWCIDLGIPYPSCFQKPAYFWSYTDSSPEEWMNYQASTPDSCNSSHELISQDSLPRLSVYRAMSRHLRKKALGDLDRKIIESSKSDPVQLSNKLSQCQATRYAFSEMLWTRMLEDRAYLWRWPRRPLSEQHKGFAVIFGNFTWAPREPWGLSSPQSNKEVWLKYHHTALECLLAWSDAVQQVGRSIDDNWADWTLDHDDWKKQRLAWYSFSRSGNVFFVGYLRNKINYRFSSSVEKHPRLSRNCIAKSLPGGRVIEYYVLGDSKFRQISGLCPLKHMPASESFFTHQDKQIRCFIFFRQLVYYSSTMDGVIQGSGITWEAALKSIRDTVSIFCQEYGKTPRYGKATMFGFEAYHLATLNRFAREYSDSFPKNPDAVESSSMSSGFFRKIRI